MRDSRFRARLRGTVIPGLEHGDRQMPPKGPESRNCEASASAKPSHGIAADDRSRRRSFRDAGHARPPSVKAANRSRDHDDRGIAATAAGKGDDMIAMRAADLQRLVIAIGEHIGEFGAQLEEMPRPGQLQMAVRPILRQTFPVRRFQRGQYACALGEIDRPPVVGIDQRKIPELRALIEIRHARHRRLQRELAQRVQGAEQRHAPGQRLERIQEFGRNATDRESAP